jgi:hypothetical protein
MATDAAQAAAPRVGIWEDFIDIFYAPSAVFRRRENGQRRHSARGRHDRLRHALLFEQRRASADVRWPSSTGIWRFAMRQNPNFPPEAVDRIRSFAVRMQQVGTFIFFPLAIAGVGVATWLAGKLVDARQSFRAAMIVAVYRLPPRASSRVS